MAAGRRGDWTDLGFLVRQQDLLHRLFLDPVAVQVKGVQDALGQILLHGGRQLQDQEVEKDRALLPFGVVVREDRGEKAVGADEAFGVALERHLPVLVQLALIDRHAGVQDRVEPVAFGPAQVAPHELVDLFLGIDLGAVQVRLQVVQLVGVGLVGQDRRPIVVRERLADGVGVVEEVEHEHIVLLGVRPVEARQGLNRLDAG